MIRAPVKLNYLVLEEEQDGGLGASTLSKVKASGKGEGGSQGSRPPRTSFPQDTAPDSGDSAWRDSGPLFPSSP